jgi:hypothetical protein
MGGELPIAGATVTLYASSSAGVTSASGVYAGTAQVLGTTTTDSSGTWGFSGVSSCPQNQIIYVASSGGDNGAGTNNNVLNVAVLGQCITATGGGLPAFTVVNEVTTVATAYAFSGFMTTSGTGSSAVVNIAAPSNNASFATSNNVAQGTVLTASGLLHAYQNALNLANMTTGTANTVPPSNSSIPAGSSGAAVAPAAVVNTLANILQACVNSTGGAEGDGSVCGNLFLNTPSLTGGFATTTLGAALNLAKNPAANVSALFALVPGTGAPPFLPALGSAPQDWTLAIAYPVPPNPVGGIGFPFTLALDADDNVYVTSPENDPWLATASTTSTGNSQSSCLFGWTSNGAFRPIITAYSGTADVAPQSGAAATLGTGTPGTSTWFCSGAQNADSLDDYVVANVAADNVGNIWLTNYTKGVTGYNRVIKVTNTGVWEANYTVPTQAGATGPFIPVGLIVDQYNNVWSNLLTSTGSVANIVGFAAGTSNTASIGLPLTIGSVTTGPTFASAGRGLAFDSVGNFFGASFGGSSGNSGTLSLGGTFLLLPLNGVQSNAANYATGSLFKKSVLGGGTSGAATNNAPYGVAIDSSNNLWVTAGGAPGQSVSSGVVGLGKCSPNAGPPFLSTTTSSTTTCSTTSVAAGFTSPKFLEADGNNVLWVADTTGIEAYASTLSTPALISEAGGFKPCIPGSGNTSTCTYPDFNTSIKGITVDSTGSVWFTTPDLTTTNPNANMLIQMIGSATPTWPLLAVQKPGQMPQ